MPKTDGFVQFERRQQAAVAFQVQRLPAQLVKPGDRGLDQLAAHPPAAIPPGNRHLGQLQATLVVGFQGRSADRDAIFDRKQDLTAAGDNVALRVR